MFENFSESLVDVGEVRLFVRSGGTPGKPPLLLLHGYPQTSAMWHLMAPLLSEDWQLIIPDLRGYGRSDKPASDPTHAPYSKRAMAADLVLLMQTLGHEVFSILSHDRGARVAHRLGLDHPEKVHAITMLDIAPTREMYAETAMGFASAYWHWFFLIQPEPLPEAIIGQNPEEFWTRKCTNQVKQQTGKSHPFSQAALAEYIDAFKDPAAVHASCEDYRAAASIDIDHDNEDGDKKLSMPLQVLWAENGAIQKYFDALSLWRKRASYVEGHAVPASHYMAEEIPEELYQLITPFLESHLT